MCREEGSWAEAEGGEVCWEEWRRDATWDGGRELRSGMARRPARGDLGVDAEGMVEAMAME